MSVLLDTNVLSELLRAQPDSKVLAWVATQPASGLFVSAVTQAEMMLGAHLLPAGKRRQQLEQALEAMFREDFIGRVLPFDSGCAADYAAVVTARRRAGTPISQFDGQIAAIALSHRLGVATRNVSDFAGCGLAVTNPWIGSQHAGRSVAALRAVVAAGVAKGNRWVFNSDQGRQTIEVSSTLGVNSADAMYGAVLHHVGIARVPAWVVGSDITRGRVRRLLPDDYPTPLPINIVYPQTRGPSSRARSLIAFLLADLASA